MYLLLYSVMQRIPTFLSTNLQGLFFFFYCSSIWCIGLPKKLLLFAQDLSLLEALVVVLHMKFVHQTTKLTTASYNSSVNQEQKLLRNRSVTIRL